jgi:putative spermidine/putrescine transport system permease protein
VPLTLLFGGGLFLAGAQSLGFFLPVEAEGGMLEGYARLAREGFATSLAFTLHVAFASAALSVAAGAVLAYAVWKLPRTLQGPALVYKVPLILPHVAVAFVVLVLWTRTGFVSSLAHAAGLIEEPSGFPEVLFSRFGLGLIMAYAYKGTGFAVLLCHALLLRLDPRLLDTARMLGASRRRAFSRVVLPHLAPVMHTTFIILFLYAFGAFDIPFLLSRSHPVMLSIQAFNLYFRRDLALRPCAMAILVVMFAMAAAFIVAYVVVVRRMQAGERRL